jgi:hypothetical protein
MRSAPNTRRRRSRWRRRKPACSTAHHQLGDYFGYFDGARLVAIPESGCG